jgi:hypothetical protein
MSAPEERLDASDTLMAVLIGLNASVVERPSISEFAGVIRLVLDRFDDPPDFADDLLLAPFTEAAALLADAAIPAQCCLLSHEIITSASDFIVRCFEARAVDCVALTIDFSAQRCRLNRDDQFGTSGLNLFLEFYARWTG